jgi:hypothetical protein
MTESCPKITRINVGHYLIILLKESQALYETQYIHTLNPDSHEPFPYSIPIEFEPKGYFLGKNSNKKNWKNISLFNVNYDKAADNKHRGVPENIASLLETTDFLSGIQPLERGGFELSGIARKYLDDRLQPHENRVEFEKTGLVALQEFMLDEYRFFWPVFAIKPLSDLNNGKFSYVNESINEGDNITLYIPFFYLLQPATTENIPKIFDQLTEIDGFLKEKKGKNLDSMKTAKNEYNRRRIDLEKWKKQSDITPILQVQRRELFDLILKDISQPVPVDFLMNKNLHSYWKFHSLLQGDDKLGSWIVREIADRLKYDIHELDDTEWPTQNSPTERLILKVDLRDFKNFFEKTSINESHRRTQAYLYHIVQLLETHGGYVIQQAGDSVFSEVEYAPDSLKLIQELLKKLMLQPWPIRMGLCVAQAEDRLKWVLQGPLELKDLSVHGKAANIAARLEAKGKTVKQEQKMISRLMMLRTDFERLKLSDAFPEASDIRWTAREARIPELRENGEIEICVIDRVFMG